MNQREQRIGENEILFREVNERLVGLNEALGVSPDRLEFLCECGWAACTEKVTLSLQEYERVRRHAELFVLFPGHEETDVEEVVERNERFAIVRKRVGEPRRLAVEHDPRE
jgi:hypothetical protein